MTWFYRLSIKENHLSHTVQAIHLPNLSPVHLVSFTVANGPSGRRPSSNDRSLDLVFLVFLFFACLARLMFFFFFSFVPFDCGRGLLHPSHNGHTQTPATIKSPQIR